MLKEIALKHNLSEGDLNIARLAKKYLEGIRTWKCWNGYSAPTRKQTIISVMALLAEDPGHSQSYHNAQNTSKSCPKSWQIQKTAMRWLVRHFKNRRCLTCHVMVHGNPSSKWKRPLRTTLPFKQLLFKTTTKVGSYARGRSIWRPKAKCTASTVKLKCVALDKNCTCCSITS